MMLKDGGKRVKLLCWQSRPIVTAAVRESAVWIASLLLSRASPKRGTLLLLLLLQCTVSVWLGALWEAG